MFVYQEQNGPILKVLLTMVIPAHLALIVLLASSVRFLVHVDRSVLLCWLQPLPHASRVRAILTTTRLVNPPVSLAAAVRLLRMIA